MEEKMIILLFLIFVVIGVSIIFLCIYISRNEKFIEQSRSDLAQWGGDPPDQGNISTYGPGSSCNDCRGIQCKINECCITDPTMMSKMGEEGPFCAPYDDFFKGVCDIPCIPYDCTKTGCIRNNTDNGQYSTLNDCKAGCDEKYCLKCDGIKASNKLNTYITNQLKEKISGLFSDINTKIPKTLNIPSLAGHISGGPFSCCDELGRLSINWAITIPSIDNISIDGTKIDVICINLLPFTNEIRTVLDIQINCSASINISPATITGSVAGGTIPGPNVWIKGVIDIGFTLTGKLDVTFSNPTMPNKDGKFLKHCLNNDWNFESTLNSEITSNSIGDTLCRLQDVACAPARTACRLVASTFDTGCTDCCGLNNCRCDTCPDGDCNKCSQNPKGSCGFCKQAAQQKFWDCDAQYNNCHKNCTDTFNNDLNGLAKEMENKVGLSTMINNLNISVTNFINTEIPILLPKIVIPHINPF